MTRPGRERSAYGDEETLARVATAESRWPASAAVVLALVIQAVLPEQLTFGPRFVLPALETVLLAGVLAGNPARFTRSSRNVRTLSLLLVAVIGAGNAVALALTVHLMVASEAENGRALIVSGMGIWLTNVIVFGLWFWELDRGGPLTRATRGVAGPPDFLFPQMATPGVAPDSWRPLFSDYLYVSFTNSTAFSPTDTMPLTGRIKMLMLAEALISLVTIALVAARAVNELQ